MIVLQNSRIDELKDELRSQVQTTNESRTFQSNKQESELSEATEKCNMIQISLQNVVMVSAI